MRNDFQRSLAIITPLALLLFTASPATALETGRTQVRTEVRTIAPYQNKQLEFKNAENGRYRMEVQPNTLPAVRPATQPAGQTTRPEPETIEADAVDLSLPLERPTNRQAQRQVQLRSLEDGKGFELESRSVKARLRDANLNYNQETGSVSLTTPAGQERPLTHLPDEVIAKLAAKGLIFSPEQELKIVANDDNLQYRVPTSRTKKLLGRWQRRVDLEIVLDDQTGEITEEEIQPPGWWPRFLNLLSS